RDGKAVNDQPAGQPHGHVRGEGHYPCLAGAKWRRDGDPLDLHLPDRRLLARSLHDTLRTVLRGYHHALARVHDRAERERGARLGDEGGVTVDVDRGGVEAVLGGHPPVARHDLPLATRRDGHVGVEQTRLHVVHQRGRRIEIADEDEDYSLALLH